MIDMNRLCERCDHQHVCRYRDDFQNMVEHLKEEFELFAMVENREHMIFQAPSCNLYDAKGRQ